MAELAINNIIKITLGIFAMIVVIMGIYFSVNDYIIPYFTGISFNQSYGATPGICNGKTFLGLIEYRAPWVETNQDFFIYHGEQTSIYFLKDQIYDKNLLFDKIIGRIQGSEIVLAPEYSGTYKFLDGAFVDGKEICNDNKI
jgi:hypothetical protein